MVEIVYVWLPPGATPQSVDTAEPPTAPALRAWADAILEIAADRWRIDAEPPVTIRKHGWFGWLTPLPPAARAAECVGRVRHELRVDGPRCATGAIDAVDELVDPMSWRRLAAHLRDQGFAAEMVEEELVPIADPTASVLVDRTRAAVETTAPELLDAMLAFFETSARAYLASWMPLDRLSNTDDSGDREVVIPSDAVLEVVRIER